MLRALPLVLLSLAAGVWAVNRTVEQIDKAAELMAIVASGDLSELDFWEPE